MVFTDDQHRTFERDGFLCVPGFFSQEEVKVMQAEIERFKAEGLLRNVATEGDGKTQSATRKNLQLCPTHPHSETFKALPFDEKVVTAVEELLGGPVRLRLDQVFLKPARDGAGTNWHQDNAYFRVSEPTKGVAMWIAVHDATVENGTMHMVPGQHHEAMEHRRDGDSDHHIRCYPDESREVPCELPAGGVVFFSYGTPHCTKGNQSDRDRAGLAYHFYHADFLPNDGQRNYPMPYLSGSDAQGGKAEYGEDQRGKWRAVVDGQKLEASVG